MLCLFATRCALPVSQMSCVSYAVSSKAVVSHALLIWEVILLSKYHADVLKCHEIHYWLFSKPFWVLLVRRWNKCHALHCFRTSSRRLHCTNRTQQKTTNCVWDSLTSKSMTRCYLICVFFLLLGTTFGKSTVPLTACYQCKGLIMFFRVK